MAHKTMKCAVVMTARERFSHTDKSVRSAMQQITDEIEFILAVDSAFPLVMLDDIKSEFPKIELFQLPCEALPTQLRNAVANLMQTPFAIFIDNDTAVLDGCFANLMACAEQTGAGMVGALCLWGNGPPYSKIHFAGGTLEFSGTEQCLRINETMLHSNMQISELEPQIERSPTGFCEFHCMLMSRELYRNPHVFDPNIRVVHEHLHASLVARQAGLVLMMEPTARVVYLNKAPFELSDLSYFARRWSNYGCEQSLRSFALQWNIGDPKTSFENIISYREAHWSNVHPLAPQLDSAELMQTKMLKTDLRMSLNGLTTSLLARGYSEKEMLLIEDIYWQAAILANGGYRPCGRPFIDHLVGMASVLVFYGFHVKYICAALLSAAFTHMPKVSDDKQKCIAYVDTFLAKTPGQHISIAKAYAEASAAWYGSGEKIWESPNEVTSAQPLILFAAHALELTLSGEVEAAARTDAMLPHLFSSIQHVMRALGLVGFCNALPTPHPNYRPSIVGCFRIVGEAFHPMFIDAALKAGQNY